MTQIIAPGSIVFVRGSEWDNCDPNEWFSGEVVQAGVKRVSVHFEGETKLCNFQRTQIEDYQREYTNSSWTKHFEIIQKMMVKDHGPAAGKAMEQAYKEIINMVGCSTGDMVNQFATEFSRELHRKAAVDIITAVMCLEEALR